MNYCIFFSLLKVEWRGGGNTRVKMDIVLSILKAEIFEMKRKYSELL